MSKRSEHPAGNPVGSIVRWGDGRCAEDANGFVTALAVRELRQSGRAVPAAWLDVLESCRRPDGSYGFWPLARTPVWAPDLPADSDDTAVMLLELTLSGRACPERARSVACHTVGSHRLRQVLDPGPPWLRRGMFITWHRGGIGRRELVDLTTVTNVLALLHALGLQRIPGVEESLAGLRAGLAWAGSSVPRWQSLSPFYPEPDELGRALEHATRCGVPGLSSAARTARQVCPRESPDAVCSMAYGPPTWHSPELAALRSHTTTGRVPRWLARRSQPPA